MTETTVINEYEREIERLKDINADLLEALEAVEWVEDDMEETEDWCMWCKNYRRYGHASDCQRQAAIRKAKGDA